MISNYLLVCSDMVSFLSVTNGMQPIGSRVVFFCNIFSVDLTHVFQNYWRNLQSNFDVQELINHTNPLKTANIATIKLYDDLL